MKEAKQEIQLIDADQLDCFGINKTKAKAYWMRAHQKDPSAAARRYLLKKCVDPNAWDPQATLAELIRTWTEEDLTEEEAVNAVQVKEERLQARSKHADEDVVEVNVTDPNEVDTDNSITRRESTHAKNPSSLDVKRTRQGRDVKQGAAGVNPSVKIRPRSRT